MSHNNESEIERTAEPKIDPALEKKSPEKAKKRVVVVRPKIVVSKSTIGRPKKSVADKTKSKRNGSKIQRKKIASSTLVRRTKRGKGSRRRRRREPKSGEGALKEDLAEEETGCYCSQLKEGVREEGEVRRGNGSNCWVCRLREMTRKCKQLRSGRQ